MNEIFLLKEFFFVTMSNDKTWIKVFQGDESFRIRINYSLIITEESKIR